MNKCKYSVKKFVRSSVQKNSKNARNRLYRRDTSRLPLTGNELSGIMPECADKKHHPYAPMGA